MKRFNTLLIVGKFETIDKKKHEGPPLKLTLRGMQADHVKTYK